VALDSKGDLRFTLWEVILVAQPDIDITEHIISVRCNYYEHGQADDFEIELENRSGIFSKVLRLGQKIEVYNWFADRPKKKHMVTYVIEDILDEAAPNVVRVSGLAADTVGKKLRTIRTRGYEGMPLSEIVKDIAKRNDLTAVFKGPDVLYKRREQKEENDLQFLTRLAELFGFIFSVKGNTLYFIARDVQEKAPTLSLEGLIRRRTFRHKTYKTYKKVRVRYYDPHKKKYIEKEIDDSFIENEQVKKYTTRFESLEEADRIAEGLRQDNRKKYECDIECMGAPELQDGINVEIRNEGIYNGGWHIEEASHNYDKSAGYTVQLTGYKIDNS
jgi:phage protein D